MVVATGCASLPGVAPWEPPAAAADFRQPGPALQSTHVVRVLPGISVDGCRAEVELHTSSATESITVVVFTHGFLHEIRHHRELAHHFASWGVPTYLVGLCPGGWTRGGARLQARLMRTVADQSGRTQIIYGGFSAGGYAAYLAALDDPRTVGLLGLDPVGQGSEMDQRIAPFPAFGLFGPANRCNANQSGRSLFRASAGDVMREIADTSHCHFESPTDWLCRIPCGEPGDAEQLRELRARIGSLATSYVRWRAGLDATAPLSWWRPVDGVLREPDSRVMPPADPASTR
jgi:pimeloyl-ACP methyl ester carboxylesterase